MNASPNPRTAFFAIRPKLQIWLFLILSIGSIAQGKEQFLTVEKLGELLEPVANLRMGADKYDDWAPIVTLAKYIKKCEPVSVSKALRELQENGARKNEFEMATEVGAQIDRKLFLTMRVLFDLPEHVSEKEIELNGWMPRFSGYVTMGKEENLDGTINFAWPLKWHLGRPGLVSGIAGQQGVNSRYKAASEFSYCVKRYSFRNLNEFRTDLR